MRSRVVLTNRAPSGPQPRLRRPAAVLRAGAHDGHRRAPPRARPGRARPPQPRARRADAVPRGRRARSTTPATTRAASTRRCELAGYDELRARAGAARATRAGCSASAWPASSSRRSPTWATSRWPRPPRSARSGLPKSGNAEGVTMAIGPHGGVTVRFTTTPQGQGHRTVAAQVVADVLGARARPTSTCAPTPTPPPTRGRSPRATTPAASPSSGASAVHRAAEQLADRLRAIAAPILEAAGGRHRARRGPRPRASATPERARLAAAARRLRALGPGRAAGGRRARPRRDRQLHPAARRRRTPTTASTPPAPTASSPTSRVVRGRPARPARSRCARYATVHDAGRILNPLHRRGPDPRRPRPRPRRGAARGAPLRRGRQPHDGDVRRLPAADRDRAAARALARPWSRRRR